MLSFSWQFKTTVYVILLASCLAQKVFRVCERDNCYELAIRREGIDKKYFEGEQSRLLTNEQNLSVESSNRNFESDGVSDKRRISEETPRNHRTKRRTTSDVTRHLNRSTPGQYQAFRQLNERFDTSLERLTRQESDSRRQEKYEVLKRLDERTREHISARHFENSRERHSNLRFKDESYFTKPQFQSDRLNNLQRFDERETSIRLNTVRSFRHNTQHRNKIELDVNRLHEFSRRRATAQKDDSEYKNREDERFIPKEREFEQHRDENKRGGVGYSGSVNRESENKIRQLISRRTPRNLEIRSEFSKECVDDDRRKRAHEDNRHYENRRESERLEILAAARIDNHNIQRDVFYRQENLLSEENSEIQPAHKNRRSENILHNRRHYHLEVTRHSGNSRENNRGTFRQINVYESENYIDRHLNEARERRNIIELQTRQQRDETSRNIEERNETFRSENLEASKQFDDPELQRRNNRMLQKSPDYDRNMQRENERSEKKREERIARLSQKREERIKNLRRYKNREDQEDRRPILVDEEYTETFRRIDSRKDVEMRQHANHRLEENIDRKIRIDANKRLASYRQDTLQRSEIRRVYEREVNKVSDPLLSLDTCNRNNREREENFESLRKKNERIVSFDEEDKHDFFRNERVEELNAERRVNSQRNSGISDIIIPEKTNAVYRNNRFIEEDNIKKPRVLLSSGYVAIGQGVIIAYVIMKIFDGKKDLKNHFPSKLGDALRVIGF